MMPFLSITLLQKFNAFMPLINKSFLSVLDKELKKDLANQFFRKGIIS